MVDSRDGTGGTGDVVLVKRVAALEQKVDALAASIDARFDAVDEAFAEQRRYTDFAFESLAAKMDARFAQIDVRFAQIDARFEQIDAQFVRMDGRFSRLERKLDAFIDTQSRTNALVERRLEALERRRRGGPRR